MEFTITSYIGAGPLLLGMTREQVRDAIGENPSKFKKTSNSPTLTDAYSCCHVHYTIEGLVEAIEFFEPANPTFNGSGLIGLEFGAIKRFFKEIDQSIETNDSGLTSLKYGIGIFAPYAETDPGEPVEGVIVFAKGYYE